MAYFLSLQLYLTFFLKKIVNCQKEGKKKKKNTSYKWDLVRRETTKNELKHKIRTKLGSSTLQIWAQKKQPSKLKNEEIFKDDDGADHFHVEATVS